MTEIPGRLRVVIRADASIPIGSGQVMRGLILGGWGDRSREVR